MEKTFYQDALTRKGITVLVPDEQDREYVNAVIYDELVAGRIRRRMPFIRIIDRLAERGAEGVICGIPLGLGLGGLIGLTGIWGGAMEPAYTTQMFVQAIVVAVVAGMVGGVYPAWRATRMRPVEALRYE